MSQTVVLISQEGQEFQVDPAILGKSLLLQSMLDMEFEESVPLPNVSAGILGLIIEYLSAHKGDEPSPIAKPYISTKIDDIVSPWDAEFASKRGNDQLKDLILAANYMDIRSLMDLCCCELVLRTKGNVTGDIETMFGLNKHYPTIIQEE